MKGIRHGLLILSAALLAAAPVFGQTTPAPAVATKKDEPIPKLVSRIDARLKHGNMIIGLAYSPNGKLLASGGWDKTIRLWDPDTGKEVIQFTGHNGAIYGVAFSPDNQAVASGSEDKTIRLWDVTTGKERLKLEGHDGGVTKVAFSPDGKSLASGSYDQTVRFWDLEAGKELRKLGGQQRGFTTIAYSPDGRCLATGAGENMALLWDVAADREYRRFQGHTGSVVGVAFSPDGRLLATASEDNSVRIWEVRSGKECRQLRGHSSGVWAVAFSPDGRMLASAGRDKNIRLWEVISGTPIRQGEEHKQGVPGLAFAPDGKSLASGSHDATGVIWDVGGASPSTRDTKAPVRFTEQELTALWADLAEPGAVRAHQAIWHLAGASQQVVPLVQQHVKPVPPVEPERLAQLLANLDHNNFATRQRASQELERLGELAGPELEKLAKSKPPLEVQHRVERLLEKLSTPISSPEALRALRSVEVLERAGTEDARKVLMELAKGAPGAQLTEDAKSALVRLGRSVSPSGAK